MSALEQLKQKFKEGILVKERSKKRIYVTAEKDVAREIVVFLYEELGARLSIATGIDSREGIEILYHMAIDNEGIFITIKTMVKKPELKMNTFSDFLPAADWIEREIHEMLGVDFTGHKNLKRLLLPDDWPEGEYPYRKKTYGSENEVTERD